MKYKSAVTVSSAGATIGIFGVPDGYTTSLEEGYSILILDEDQLLGDVVTEFQGVYLTTNAATASFYEPYSFTWGSSGGADVAEEYLVEDESIAPGDVVSISDTGSLYIERSEASSTEPVFGIVSTKPGLRLTDFDRNPNNNRAVALNGRVPVRVSEENGPVKIGDRLTLSRTLPGVAMRQTQPGQSVGIAMEASPNKDKVMTFVNLSYWVPTEQSTLILNTSSTTSTSTASSTASSTTEVLLDNMMSYVIKVFKEVFDVVFERGLMRLAKIIVTDEFCMDDVCITKDEFKTLLEKNGIMASATQSDNQETSDNDQTASTTETTFSEVVIEDNDATSTEDNATSTEEVTQDSATSTPTQPIDEEENIDSSSTEPDDNNTDEQTTEEQMTGDPPGESETTESTQETPPEPQTE